VPADSLVELVGEDLRQVRAERLLEPVAGWGQPEDPFSGLPEF
jgi:hypothetical protein